MLLSTPLMAQVSDDRVEENIDRATEVLTPAERAAEERGIKGRFSSNLNVTAGYDTNPRLTGIRKGDHYQTARFNANYRKTAHKRNQFSVSMDLTETTYNEFSNLSNLLGHIRFEYKGAISKKYILGLGYDYSFTEYHSNNATTFHFPYFFSYAQYRVNKNFYHKLQYDFGWKRYQHAKALLQSTTTFQDNKRKDKREGLEYSLGYTLTDRLSSTFSFKAFNNSSNSFFQDYYDYISYKARTRLSYRVNDKLLTHFTYSWNLKEYDSRQVTSGTYERVDKLFTVKTGLNYKLNDRHRLSLNYTYRENDTNNKSSFYTGSTFEGGWRYTF